MLRRPVEMSAAAPLAGSDSDCSLLNEDNSNYNLRIAALFAILGASTIGGCLPLITRRAKLGNASNLIKLSFMLLQHQAGHGMCPPIENG